MSACERERRDFSAGKFIEEQQQQRQLQYRATAVRERVTGLITYPSWRTPQMSLYSHHVEKNMHLLVSCPQPITLDIRLLL